MATRSGVKAGNAWVSIGAVDETSIVLDRVARKINRWAGNMIARGRSMMRQAVVAFAPIALSTKVFASFDDAMRRVEARSKGTRVEMEKLTDQAKRLGRETSSTATEIANLQAKLAQKGFSRSEIFDMTPNVRNLAQGAGEGDENDAVVAADLMSGTMRAFQMETKESARVADVFTFAVNNSNFSLESLLDGMSKASPLAADYNMTLEETVATLASMTNLNIAAAESGTAFVSFLSRMSKQEFTDKFNDGLKELTGQTVAFRDSENNLRKPLRILQAIGEATKDLGTAQRGDLLGDLFGVRQFGKAAGGARGAIDAQQLLSALQTEAQGAAQKTADTMDAGIGGTLRRIWSAVQGAAIKLGETLELMFVGFEKAITGTLATVTEWIGENKKLVTGIVVAIAAYGALGAAITTVGVALIPVAMGLSMVASLLGAIGTVLSLVTSGPVAFFLIGLGLVLKTMWDLQRVAPGVAKWIVNQFSALGNVFGQVTRDILDFIGYIGSGFRSVFSDVFDLFGLLQQEATTRFQSISEVATGTFDGFLTALTSGQISAAFELAMNGIKIIWFELIDALKDSWSSFSDFFVEAWLGFMQLIGRMSQSEVGEALSKRRSASMNADNQRESRISDLRDRNLQLRDDIERNATGPDSPAGEKTRIQKLADQIKSELLLDTGPGLASLVSGTAGGSNQAFEMGTSASFQAINKFTQGKTEKPMEKMSKGIDKTAKNTEKTAKSVRELERKVIGGSREMLGLI